nr:hypothetical protein [Paenibacillus qinlingensis]
MKRVGDADDEVCCYPSEALNKSISGIETPTPLEIGYAGCALGTSDPLLKDIGVVKMRDTFDIYIGGEPKSLKPSFAVLLMSNVQEDRLIQMVQRLIQYFQQHGKMKEKFSKFINRITIEALHEAITE